MAARGIGVKTNLEKLCKNNYSGRLGGLEKLTIRLSKDSRAWADP